MVKCGSCRAINADSYIRVTDGHKLFNILLNLNPTHVYNEKNSYFCGLCITKATNNLGDVESMISKQSSNSLSVANESIYFTASDSSKGDEYDVMVSRQVVFSGTGTSLSLFPPPPIPSRISFERKRAAQETTKPCPKRFKEQSTTVNTDDIMIPTTSNISEEVIPTTLSQLSETDMLLSFQRDDNNVESYDSSDALEKSIGSRELLQQEQHTNAVAKNVGALEQSVGPRVSVQQDRTSHSVAKSSGNSGSHVSDTQNQPGSASTSDALEKSIGSRELLQQEQHTNAVAKNVGALEQSVGSRVSVQQDRTSHSVAKSSGNSGSHVSDTQNQPSSASTSDASEKSVGHCTLVQESQRSDTDVAASATSSKTAAVSVRKELEKTKSNIGQSSKTAAVSQRGIQLRYDSDLSYESEIQYPWASREQLAEVDIENEPIVSNLQLSESDLPIASLVAPSAKNPRTRESNSNVAGDVRRYFGENQQTINVNNYSRSLAG